jgi:hypothetical protein
MHIFIVNIRICLHIFVGNIDDKLHIFMVNVAIFIIKADKKEHPKFPLKMSF